MQLSSLKTAIKAILVQADFQRGQNERQLFYLYTGQALAFLLNTPGESTPGWPKAALALLRPLTERQSGPLAATSGAMSPARSQDSGSLSAARSRSSRPLVEVMTPAPLAETQECLLTILDLPDITTISSLNEVQAALESAITVGAPRYNRGDVAGCARLYFATALTLVNAQVSRGFSGQARALDMLKKGLEDAQALNDVDERAWTLRRAFDRVLA